MVSNSFTGYSDTDLLASMAQDEKRAFTEIYDRYWKLLFGYAYNKLRDKEKCREIIQDVFLTLWERRSELQNAKLRNYLFSAVTYCIFHTMKSKGRLLEFANRFYALYPSGQVDTTLEEQHKLEHLEARIEKSLSHLPDNYARAFRLSRLEHLTSAEIAKRMNISVRTVENYITHALKHLRGSLGEMMVVVWLVMIDW